MEHVVRDGGARSQPQGTLVRLLFAVLVRFERDGSEHQGGERETLDLLDAPRVVVHAPRLGPDIGVAAVVDTPLGFGLARVAEQEHAAACACLRLGHDLLVHLDLGRAELNGQRCRITFDHARGKDEIADFEAHERNSVIPV